MSSLLTLLLLLVMNRSAVAADSVEELLAQFDQRPSDVALANQFFDELLKENFIDEVVTFAPDTPSDSLCQQVWYWAAEWLYDQQDYQQAEHYALKALPKYHPSNLEKSDCLNTLGCIYVRLSDLEKAAYYTKQSAEMEIRTGDADRISSSLNTLAGIYLAGYQLDEAEQIILKALKYADRADNPARKAILLGMASEIYHSRGDDQKALDFAEQAYAIERQLGRTTKIPIRLSQKGSALLGLHRYQEAEEIYRQIIPSLKAAGDYHSYAIALNRMGMALLCQNRQREAIPYYRQAAELFSKMGDLYNEIHAHRGLYECYWTLNPDSAKIELDYWDLLKDSLYTHSSAEALNRYNAEFGNEYLQWQNAEQRKAHGRTIVISILAILLVVMVAWLIIRSVRRRQQHQMQAMIREIERLRLRVAESLSAAPTEVKETTTPAPTVQTTQQPDDESAQQFLLRVIEIANRKMATGSMNVEQVAFELNMSVQTFRRRIQEATGQSPKAYLQAIQMGQAAHLLLTAPDTSITKIAHLCGFEDTSSFSHAFRRIYGCSPTEYRSNNN